MTGILSIFKCPPNLQNPFIYTNVSTQWSVKFLMDKWPLTVRLPVLWEDARRGWSGMPCPPLPGNRMCLGSELSTAKVKSARGAAATGASCSGNYWKRKESVLTATKASILQNLAGKDRRNLDSLKRLLGVQSRDMSAWLLKYSLSVGF